MHLTQNGVTITMDDAEVVCMALDRLNGSAYPSTLRGIAVPRIGENWAGQGGAYAGIGRGVDGPDFHLIVGPEYDGKQGWNSMMAAAKEIIVDGKGDFTLPTRKEQALAFANVPELFQADYYWSGEKHVSDSACASCQLFGNGNQHYDLTLLKLRARFFRRSIRAPPC